MTDETGRIERPVAPPAGSDEIRQVVERLRSLIGGYLMTSAKSGLTASPVEILSVIDALEREADGQPSPAPDGGSAQEFLLHGLYLELVAEPSNIFQTIRRKDGRECYVPIDSTTWKLCLHALRESMR